MYSRGPVNDSELSMLQFFFQSKYLVARAFLDLMFFNSMKECLHRINSRYFFFQWRDILGTNPLSILAPVMLAFLLWEHHIGGQRSSLWGDKHTNFHALSGIRTQALGTASIGWYHCAMEAAIQDNKTNILFYRGLSFTLAHFQSNNRKH